MELSKLQLDEIVKSISSSIMAGSFGTSGIEGARIGATQGIGKVTPNNNQGFMKDFFGDKGVLSGVTNAITGLGGLALSFGALTNAKKQQKFANRAMTTQLNNSYQVYDDGINQRSQSQAASLGLQGQARQDYVNSEKERTQLQRI